MFFILLDSYKIRVIKLVVNITIKLSAIKHSFSFLTICVIKLCENKIIILLVLLDQFDKNRNHLFYYSAIMSIKTTSFVFLILQYSFIKFFIQTEISLVMLRYNC